MSNIPTENAATRHSGAWFSPIPVFFVLLWSSGFIVAKFGLPYAPPLTFLLLRCSAVLLVLLPWIAVARAPWPRREAPGVPAQFAADYRSIGHIAVAGLLLQAGYLGGIWTAIKLGMPAGLAALIAGMQPILTAAAAPLIGERVRPLQWLGLALGLAGVALVVYSKIGLSGLSGPAVGLCLLALLSITAGTMYQKHFCPRFDLRTGTAIQFAATVAALLPLAMAFEQLDPGLSTVKWTPQFVGALLWSVFGLSIGAIFLLFKLIRRSEATAVTSLLYLTPPTTAIMAWIMFGEALGIAGVLGMVVAVAGVAFVVKKQENS